LVIGAGRRNLEAFISAQFHQENFTQDQLRGQYALELGNTSEKSINQIVKHGWVAKVVSDYGGVYHQKTRVRRREQLRVYPRPKNDIWPDKVRGDIKADNITDLTRSSRRNAIKDISLCKA